MEANSVVSFHRRPLPSTCISLSSSRGQQLFQSAMQNNGTKAFFDLISQYHTQTDPAFCGPSTLVMILNALNVDPRKQWKQGAPWRWYSEEMLNCCIDLDTIRKTGITFSTFVCLAKCQGLCADGYYASESSLDEFRRLVRSSCCHHNLVVSNALDSDEKDNDIQRIEKTKKEKKEEGPCQECTAMYEEESKMYLAVSYNRKVLQQTGTGHFSPIAAYDVASDHVLILDTARFKYTPHWVPLELLFCAMLSVDPETNKSRGFIALSFEPDEKICSSPASCTAPMPFPLPLSSTCDSSSLTSNSSSTKTLTPCLYLPQSILFRSKRSQNPARRKFKDFLQKHSPQSQLHPPRNSPFTFEQIYNYWTDGGENTRKVWSILEPAPIPIDMEGRETVQGLVDHTRHLLMRAWSEMSEEMGSDKNKSNGSGSGSGSRVILNMKDMDDSFVPCSMRTVPITALETIYVIYLSTLNREHASEIIRHGLDQHHPQNNVQKRDPVMIVCQLLAEADLIRKAIDLSNFQNCVRGGCCS